MVEEGGRSGVRPPACYEGKNERGNCTRRRPVSVFDHMAWAKKQRTGSVGAKAVLMALAERTGEEPVCFPSQPLLAAETEQCERTVRTHLRTLEDLGLIESSRRYVDASGKPLPRGRACNQYRLLIDQPADVAGGQPVGDAAASSGESGGHPGDPAGDVHDQPANRARPTGNRRPTNRQAVAGEVPVELPWEQPPYPPPGPPGYGSTIPAEASNHPAVVSQRRREQRHRLN